MQGRRVVITGLGVVSPLGCDLETVWQNLLSGKSGIKLIDRYDTSGHACRFAGLVEGFVPEDYGLSSKDSKKMDMFIQYGIAAAESAIKHAGLQADDRDDVGVLMGSGIGGLSTIEANHAALQIAPRKVSPFFIPASIVNLTSGHISMRHNYRGPNVAVSTACTTGAHAIGLAARMIAYGDAEVMIAGGSEFASTPLGMAGFASARALSTRNDEPTKASRPWDKDRDGFVLGDGGAALVLETYEHAKARGATILAELSGFGMSADAYHMTKPWEDGRGFSAALGNALRDAGIDKSAVDHVNAHATSTPLGDVAECQAIKEMFGEHAKNIAVSATKSMTGHLLGAAGAIESVFTVLAIRDQVAPPTINLENPSEGCDLNFVANEAQKREINVAVSNSFGFGGTNGSLVFQKV